MCKRCKKPFSSQFNSNEDSDVVKHDSLNDKRDTQLKKTLKKYSLFHVDKKETG